MALSQKQKDRAETEGFDATSSVVDTLASALQAFVADRPPIDPDAARASILQRIMEAPDDLAVLGMGASSALSAEDIGDESFRIVAVEWAKSSPAYTEGMGVFVILRLRTIKANREEVVTCGGANVLAQLWKLTKGGTAEVNRELAVKFIERTTAAGFKTLWLASA